MQHPAAFGFHNLTLASTSTISSGDTSEPMWSLFARV